MGVAVVRAALAAALIAAAVATGSASVLAAGLLMLVLAVRETTVLVGRQRAQRPPDARHPLGYGRELYFWTGVLGVLAMGIAAGLAIAHGLHAMLGPRAVPTRPELALGLIALAFAVEAVLWWRAPVADGGASDGLEIDPVGRAAALLGLALAFAGVAASASGRPTLAGADGIGAVLVGLVIAGAAVRVARRAWSPMIGATADTNLIEDILGRAGRAGFVDGVNEVRALQVGPGDVVVNVSVDARDALDVGTVEAGIAALEAEILAVHPAVSRVFVEIRRAAGRAFEPLPA